MTSKTKSRALPKHCTLCQNKRILGNSVSYHVSAHVKKGITKENVKLVKCIGDNCALCSVAPSKGKYLTDLL
jgi:hypothetical protein